MISCNTVNCLDILYDIDVVIEPVIIKSIRPKWMSCELYIYSSGRRRFYLRLIAYDMHTLRRAE